MGLSEDDQNETAKPQLEFKEVAVLIPLIGTAIAISYDVGYFYGIDIHLFTLFSLAEHILFAFAAAPVAFVLAICLTAYFGPGLDIAIGLKISAVGQKLEKRTRRVVDAGVLALVILSAGAIFYFRHFGVAAFMLSGAAIALFRFLPIPRRAIYSISCVLVIVTAFAVGHDFARNYVLYGPVSHSIQLENDTLAIKLIRSGDRGVLYFEPKAKQLNFVR